MTLLCAIKLNNKLLNIISNVRSGDNILLIFSYITKYLYLVLIKKVRGKKTQNVEKH